MQLLKTLKSLFKRKLRAGIDGELCPGCGEVARELLADYADFYNYKKCRACIYGESVKSNRNREKSI